MKYLLEFSTILLRVNESGKITHRGDYIPNGKSELSWMPVGRGDVPPARELRTRIRGWLEHFGEHWIPYWNWSEDCERSPIVPECAAESLCPFCGDGASMFLKDLIEYPRFVTPDRSIQVGGLQYVGAPKRIPGVTYERKEGPLEIAARGTFDSAVGRFLDYVRWLGRRCGCTDKAVVVVGRLASLVDWIDHVLPETQDMIEELDARYGLLAEALVAMSESVGRWQPPRTESAELDASSVPVGAPPKVAAINMDRICKSRRRKPSKKDELRSDMILFVEECIVKAWRHFSKGDVKQTRNCFGEKLKTRKKRTYAKFVEFCKNDFVGSYPAPKVDYYLGAVVNDPATVKKLVHKYRDWRTESLRGSRF